MNHRIFFAFILLLSSCSFNRYFMYPEKFEPGTKTHSYYFRSSGDSMHVYFSAEYAPLIVRNRRDTVREDYTIEGIVFRNRKGKQLSGWFLKPRIVKAQATILHLHGNAGNLLWHYRVIGPLVSKGLQVFMFDYSGFGFSEGKPTQKGVLEDAEDALCFLKGKSEVRGTKVIVYGQSLGGHLAVALAERKEKEIDAVVIEGAFSSHRDIAAHQAKRWGWLARILVRSRYHAKRSVEKMHKPLLIIHSTEDKIIPFYMGKRIYDHANEPKEFYEIKGPHVFGPILYRDSIATKIYRMVR